MSATRARRAKAYTSVAILSATALFWLRYAKVSHLSDERGAYAYQFYSALNYIWRTGHKPTDGVVEVSDYTHGFYLGLQDPLKNVYPAVELQILGLDTLDGFFLMARFAHYRSLLVVPVIVLGLYALFCRQAGRRRSYGTMLVLYLASISLNWLWILMGSEWNIQSKYLVTTTFLLLVVYGLVGYPSIRRHRAVTTALVGLVGLVLYHRTGTVFLITAVSVLGVVVVARILLERSSLTAAPDTSNENLGSFGALEPQLRALRDLSIPIGIVLLFPIVVICYYAFFAPRFLVLAAKVLVSLVGGGSLLSLGGGQEAVVVDLRWGTPDRVLWFATVGLSLGFLSLLAWFWYRVPRLESESIHSLGVLSAWVGGLPVFGLLFFALGGLAKTPFRLAQYGTVATLLVLAFGLAVARWRMIKIVRVAVVFVVLISAATWGVTTPPVRGGMHEDEAVGIETVAEYTSDDAVIFSDLRIGTLSTWYDHFRITGAVTLRTVGSDFDLRPFLRALYYDKPASAGEALADYRTMNERKVDYVVMSSWYTRYGVQGNVFRVQEPEPGYVERYENEPSLAKVYTNGNVTAYEANY